MIAYLNSRSASANDSNLLPLGLECGVPQGCVEGGTLECFLTLEVWQAGYVQTSRSWNSYLLLY